MLLVRIQPHRERRSAGPNGGISLLFSAFLLINGGFQSYDMHFEIQEFVIKMTGVVGESSGRGTSVLPDQKWT